MKRALLGLGMALALLASAAPIDGPARGAELYAPETLDRYFTLEWSRAGRNLNGYVYNTGNRRAAQMSLLVEGLDGSRTVWIAARPGSAQPAGSPAVTAMHWPERFLAASLQR
jgi:hypothetical protein